VKVGERTDFWGVRRMFCRLSRGCLVAHAQTNALYAFAVKEIKEKRPLLVNGKKKKKK
jgi:hypothetical protein